ncbi:MAG TPA: hypothetical protein VLK65_19785 [Vicinamibacteria bacterium]|nr:hypothetical protein [Vicinamibacteria bacterium]
MRSKKSVLAIWLFCAACVVKIAFPIPTKAEDDVASLFGLKRLSVDLFVHGPATENGVDRNQLAALVRRLLEEKGISVRDGAEIEIHGEVVGASVGPTTQSPHAVLPKGHDVAAMHLFGIDKTPPLRN